MNLGGDAADQVVRYSLEGIDYSLRLSGTLAKNLAVFLAAVLKDQKKTYGKTRMVRMLKENRPLKFFTVPSERLKEFAREGKKRGLLYVVIRDRKNPAQCEIMVFADDAAKVNRVMDKMNLDFLKSESGKAVQEVAEARESAKKEPEVSTETVIMPEGEVQFEIDEEGLNFGFEDPSQDTENFTKVQEKEEKNPSGPSLHNSGISTGEESFDTTGRMEPAIPVQEHAGYGQKPSVRAELEGIKQEKREAKKLPAVKRTRRPRQSSRKKRRTKSKSR